ncbi:MAG: EAL domain-containing protein [Gallionella sp.]|nr:EAL domain-containing protein [Gallionella sp.]
MNTFIQKKQLSFSSHIWLTMGIFALLVVLFSVYVWSEKEIDRLYEVRHQSILLTDELRQSSDDLTRMVRTYVVTKDVNYKDNYQAILDIRDGRKPRSQDYHSHYLDIVLVDGQLPISKNTKAISLLDLMRQAGFTNQEFHKLAEAKTNSDRLTATEFEAMRLIELPDTGSSHAQALAMLHDSNYHQAKADIMRPIHDVNVLVEDRTADAVQLAKITALILRSIFIALALSLAFMLYRTHQFLQMTLGGSVDKIHEHISRMGSGDFSFSTLSNFKLDNSVLGWLTNTRHRLHQMDLDRKQTEQQLLESKQRFHQMFLLHDSPMLLIEPESGMIQDANQAASNFYGYSIDHLKQMNIEAINTLPPEELAAERMRAAREQRNYFIFPHRLANGSLRTVEVHSSPMSLGGQTVLFSIIHDITDRQQAEAEIKLLAFYDPLTSLANRRLLTDRMEQTLAFARRSNELVVICMLDLDGFKQVNDQFGHKLGDQLLIEVARRLQECVRESDTASRFGGDEFALILGGFKNIDEIEQTLSRVISSLSTPYLLDNKVAHVSASLGATIFPNDVSDPDLLLRHADQSMYEAKQAGKNCYQLFNPTHHNQQQANQATLKKIEHALADGQFTLYYQPQVDCRQGKVVGVEALIRWNHPILGLLLPSEFIPLVEHQNLIVAMGEWTIQEALKQLVAWRAEGLNLSLSVNISQYHLHKHNFISRLNDLLMDYDSEIINRLGIEILETGALEDVNTVANAIQQCRNMGIHVSLDDFGTGFSSLTHLKLLPADALKIDQSFVRGMLHNPDDLAIVSGVVGLASAFQRNVVAEGVESIDHILMLMEMGCFLMQGYCISRPMPAEHVTSWVQAFHPDPLWQLPSTRRPSRGYFELLLAEVNHRHWIDRQIEKSSNMLTDFNSHSLLDEQGCHFGRWYAGDGLQEFGKENWFHSIAAVHRKIHQTAARLCEHQHGGDLTATQMDAESLFAQHDELDHLLSHVRGELAHNYNTTGIKQ